MHNFANVRFVISLGSLDADNLGFTIFSIVTLDYPLQCIGGVSSSRNRIVPTLTAEARSSRFHLILCWKFDKYSLDHLQKYWVNFATYWNRESWFDELRLINFVPE